MIIFIQNLISVENVKVIQYHDKINHAIIKEFYLKLDPFQ